MSVKSRSVVPLFLVAFLAVACGNPHHETGSAQPSSTPTIEGTLTVASDDPRAGVASTLTFAQDIPAGQPYPTRYAADVPVDWDISGWRAKPGTIVGKLVADLRIGVAHRDCTVPVHAEFRLLSAAADGPTVSTTAMTVHPPFADVFEDGNGNGVPDGADRVPDFVPALNLPGTPCARAYGQSLVSTFPVFVDLVTRDLGGGHKRLYFMTGDPNYQSPVVTSICTPLHSTLQMFGVSPDGATLLRNPSQPGSVEWHVELNSDASDTSQAATGMLNTTVDLQPAPSPDETVIARRPDVASLPPVYNPEDHSNAPNPSAPILNPDDAPKQKTGDAGSLGRPDCPNGWKVVLSQDGWSVCHPTSWTYRQVRNYIAGIWEDGFALDENGVADTAGHTSARGAIAIHHVVVGRVGVLLPRCNTPASGSLNGFSAEVCRSTGAAGQAPSSQTAAVAYYVPFNGEQIALEGASYSDDPTVMSEIEAIFATLRLQ